MIGISHLRQPLQENVAEFYSQKKAANAHQPGAKPVKPKIAVPAAEDFVLGDNSFWGTVQGIAICLATFGIAPLVVFLTQLLDKRYVHSDDIADTVSQMGIDDSDAMNWLYRLSPDEVRKVRDIVVDSIETPLNTERDEIFASLDYAEGDNDPIVLSVLNDDITLIVRRGSIYWRQNGADTLLMSCGQYLNTIDGWKFAQNGGNLKAKNLSELNLTGINLAKVNIATFNLSRANLSNANLTECRMNGTNLSGATLTNVKLAGAKFFWNTNLTDTTITLALPAQWDEDTLDAQLSYELNDSAQKVGGLLPMIESIDDKYRDLKLNLMHQIIDSLNGADISTVQSCLLSTILTNEIFRQDPNIRQFLRTLVSAKQLRESDEESIKSYFNLISVTGSDDEKKAFMLNYNSFFVQYLARSVVGKDMLVREREVDLYREYMDLDELKAYKNFTLFANADETIDGNREANLQETREIDKDDPVFVLLNTDPDNTTHALIVSQRMLEAMLDPDPYVEYDWAGNMFYLRNGHDPRVPPEQAYQHFPYLYAKYKIQMNRSVFSKLLTLVNLNFENETDNPNTRARDYRELFHKAQNAKFSEQKLTDLPDQVALAEIFNPLLDEERGITDKHYAEISRIYGLQQKTDTEKAKILFCLSTVITKYSSAYIFGEEGNSPEMLRNYAAGLMTKAYQFDRSIFLNNIGQDQYAGWDENQYFSQDGWYGRLKANRCSDLIQKEMKAYAKISGFQNIMNDFMPVAWR